MTYHIFEDYQALSEQAAQRMLTLLRENEHPVFVLASGASPALAYQIFAERAEPKDTARLTIVVLDEWFGLPQGHSSSCYTFIQRYVLKPARIPEEQCIAFCSDAPDPTAECERLEQIVSSLTISLTVLGIGQNGHIGFNEPAPEFRLNAHHAQLSETSMRHPMVWENRSQIQGGLTLGLGSIFASENILLLANGAAKREVVARWLSTPLVSPQYPVSALRLHPSVTALLDREAAEGLPSSPHLAPS